MKREASHSVLVLIGTAVLISIVALSCRASAWVVPDDPGCETIQSCIAQAVDGDTITVRPGTYSERIDFLGKAVTLRSQDGPSVTIIDGGAAGNVVTFQSGEGGGSVLEGFTIRNAAGSASGGGVYCSGASPVIRGNIITQNKAHISGGGIYTLNGSPLIENNQITQNQVTSDSYVGYGGGLYCEGGSPVIRDNVISGNLVRPLSFYATAWGAGIYCKNSTPTIVNNLISQNTASGVYIAQGGGISLYNSLSPSSPIEVAGNTIVENSLQASSWEWATSDGGGIFIYQCDRIAILNNIVAKNTSSASGDPGWAYGKGIHVRECNSAFVLNNTVTDNRAATHIFGIYVKAAATASVENNVTTRHLAAATSVGLCVEGSGSLTADYNDVWLNGLNYCTQTILGSHDLSADPLFVDPDTADYHLRPESPCIDAGDNSAPDLPPADIDGDGRVLDGDCDGVAVVDIGADEFVKGCTQPWGTPASTAAQMGMGALEDAASRIANYALLLSGPFGALVVSRKRSSKSVPGKKGH
jgi:hypothetical protein